MKSKSGFTIIELLVCLVFVAAIGGMIALVCFGVKGCNHVAKHGVKSVANDIWEGPATNSPDNTLTNR